MESVIETFCTKKNVFANPPLLFGTTGEAHAHCIHLHIAQADPKTKICNILHKLLSIKKKFARWN